MNIAFIGPGIMPIPPDGWGAVEMLIWDYATVLGELEHTGTIINTPNRSEIIGELKEEEFIKHQADHITLNSIHQRLKEKTILQVKILCKELMIPKRL